MARTRRFQQLVVWANAMDFADEVYDVTERWPATEVYRVVDQVRRAAISIPANIAEGQGRRGSKEFAHHLSIAYGSLTEAETLLMIACRRKFIGESEAERLLAQSDEVSRLLQGTIQSLQRAIANPTTKQRPEQN